MAPRTEEIMPILEMRRRMKSSRVVQADERWALS